MPTPEIEKASWIQKTPGVCGGDACIRNTRIPVWLLIAWMKDGLPDQRIREHHPDVTQADLDSAREYYAGNQGEIDEAIRANEEP